MDNSEALLNMRAMAESQAYHLVEKRIQMAIEQQRTQLENHMEMESTMKCRGIILGLRLALQVPDLIMADLRAAASKAGEMEDE